MRTLCARDPGGTEAFCVLHTTMAQRGGAQQCICQICSLGLSLTCQRRWQHEQITLERLLDDMLPREICFAALCSQHPGALRHMLRLFRKLLQTLLELIFPASLKTNRPHKGLRPLSATALTLHGLLLLRTHRQEHQEPWVLRIFSLLPANGARLRF